MEIWREREIGRERERESERERERERKIERERAREGERERERATTRLCSLHTTEIDQGSIENYLWNLLQSLAETCTLLEKVHPENIERFAHNHLKMWCRILIRSWGSSRDSANPSPKHGSPPRLCSCMYRIFLHIYRKINGSM